MFGGGDSESLRRFGSRVLTSFVGLFEVNCVTGKLAGSSNDKKAGSEEAPCQDIHSFRVFHRKLNL